MTEQVQTTDESIYSYIGREQTECKHFILREYLSVLAMKLGMTFVDTFNYIDCFAGPWESECEDFDDTSPKIALNELISANENLNDRGKNMQMRFFFVEKKKTSFTDLQKIIEPFQASYNIGLSNSKFTSAIPEIQNFVNQAKETKFSFFFIDPTGWTGFGMDQIKTLLRENQGEVFVNLMIQHIRRFIDQEDNKPSFEELFGMKRTEEILEKVKNLNELEKDEVIVEEYCKTLKEIAGYQYVAHTLIFNPDISRSHFYLIYGTRNIVGLNEFTRIGDKILEHQKTEREVIKENKKFKETLQGNIFEQEEFASIKAEGNYVDVLVTKYRGQAKEKIRNVLKLGRVIEYDELMGFALELPMMSQKILKAFLAEWKKEGKIIYSGGVKQVPKMREGHCVQWIL